MAGPLFVNFAFCLCKVIASEKKWLALGGKLEEATNGAAKDERTSMMRWKTRLSWDATLQSTEIRCSASP
jgi:hypothetical protein